MYPFGTLIGSQFTFVTDEMWKNAFVLAVSGQEVPVYSNLFFDSINAAASRDYGRAIMNVAMALESCRDQNFSRMHPSTNVEGRGPQLEVPFDHTDLLKHLSMDARETFGRDFSAEHPDEWQLLRDLYVARHHVAHGKMPVFPTPMGLRTVNKDSFAPILLAAGVGLHWMETLQVTKLDNRL